MHNFWVSRRTRNNLVVHKSEKKHGVKCFRDMTSRHCNMNEK